MRKYIEKNQLEHGLYYEGHCRNAGIARWDANRNKFFYWRQKFGEGFFEEINHCQDDNGYDLFYPQKINHLPMRYIPLDDDKI